MRNYYDEQIPIDEILSELKFYVLCVTNLMSKINSITEYSYHDDSLGERLSGYDDDIVIPKLESFILALKSIGYEDIKKSIPDYDSADINYLEEERQKVLSGIKETIVFLQGLINSRLSFVSVKMKKLFDFPQSVTDEMLKGMAKCLEEQNMIKNATSLTDILRGKTINEKIVWVSSKVSFYHFLTELFEQLKLNGHKWELADAFFTFQNKTIKDSKMSKNSGNISKYVEIQINTAISYLIP